MGACDEKLQAYLGELPVRTIPDSGVPADGAQPAIRQKARRSNRKPRGNAPDWDLRPVLQQTMGVDLTRIDGIDVMTAQTFLAEIGLDLSAFPSEDHFASWLGLTPNKRITGGKVVGRERRKVRSRVAGALRMAASTLKESRSWLGAYYRHKCRTLPSKASAVKATARYLAVLVYRMLIKRSSLGDCGAQRFGQRRQEIDLAILTSRAQAKGFKLVPSRPRTNHRDSQAAAGVTRGP
jgi:hypothetical protein